MRPIDADALKKDLTRFYDNEVTAKRLIDEQPTIEPQLDAEFAEAVRTMFANVWECEIDHPKYQNTVGEILEKVIELHNSVPPMKLDEWCESCKEYDQTTHSCPRFNRVIRTTLDDVRKEAYKHGKSKGIKKGMAMAQRWIPVTERLPDDIRPVIVTWCNTDPESYYQHIVGKRFTGVAHYKSGKWYWYSSTTEDFLAEYGRYESEEFDKAIEVLAWMPLPEPYKGEQE